MNNWKLNENNFTFADRLKICSFFLSHNNFWTMSDKVLKFESQMANFTDCKYSLFVSSGSTANSILASYLKDEFYEPNEKNIVVFPSTTWITSVSPFIREGFEPKFIDISLTNYAIDLDKLETYLDDNQKYVRCVFITSLLGFNPDFERLKLIEEKYEVKIMVDNCENTFSQYDMKNASSYFTSTTSTYFGHQLQSVEGGFIFTNNKEEKDYFSMYRNHGLTRSVRNMNDYSNPKVDPKFDFFLLGNNSRNSNINAFIGSLDFERINKYKSKRLNLYNLFKSSVNRTKIILPVKTKKSLDIPFCLPLLFHTPENKRIIQKYCDLNGIESRPIVSGNLLRQTCLEKFDDYKNFYNSEFVNNNGIYVGLHSQVKEKQIEKLASAINNL
jgi:CDP-4-dehydro-6-deoxyglucose reductase, E1